MHKKLLLLILLLASANAESLRSTLKEMLQTNPIIQERLKNYNATKEDITTAKSGYYPKVDLVLSGGQEKIDRENTDTDYSFYANSLKYTQNLFNGFSTTYFLQEEEYRTLSAAYSYLEKVNETSFDLVNSYLEMMRNQELLQTYIENVKIDQQILTKVKKLYHAGLTTLSEVNKVESSLALAKSNLVVQENNILNANYNLQKVFGRALNVEEMSEPKLDNFKLPMKREDAIKFAFKHNPSLLISEYNIKLAEATNKEKKSAFYPKLDIEVSQSLNHNVSGIAGKDDEFRAMAYLTYNLFNGFNDKAALQKSISTVYQEVENKNGIRRDIIQKLNLAWAAREKLEEQFVHLIAYKNFAHKTLKLYTKEYDLGRRSLLDLLSAQNDFIQSKAQIITARYNILIAKYRILDAMGILVQTIMGDTENIYANVGLNGKVPKNNDTLPVRYDRDNDLIVNDMDICDTSIQTNLRDRYGCNYTDQNITQIERYTGFFYDGDKLTEESKRKIKNLIKQLQPYGVKKIKFDLLSNAQDDSLSTNELINLSKKRAQTIVTLLTDAGADSKNITIIANGNDAPLYGSNDERNNRIDIIVKKLR